MGSKAEARRAYARRNVDPTFFEGEGHEPEVRIERPEKEVDSDESRGLFGFIVAACAAAVVVGGLILRGRRRK